MDVRFLIMQYDGVCVLLLLQPARCACWQGCWRLNPFIPACLYCQHICTHGGYIYTYAGPRVPPPPATPLPRTQKGRLHPGPAQPTLYVNDGKLNDAGQVQPTPVKQRSKEVAEQLLENSRKQQGSCCYC